MNTSGHAQTCTLRTPEPSEQRRYQRSEGISFLLVSCIPLILLIPVIATPKDPEIPRMIAAMIGMEAFILLVYRRSLFAHKTRRMYFDASCLQCHRKMTWRLGSSKYGLDKKGAFRCRCNAPYSYETIHTESVEVRPRPPQNALMAAIARLVPRAWTSA